MKIIKSIIRWIFVLLIAAIAMFVVDIMLLNLLHAIDGTVLMYLWYALIILAPMIIQYFIFRTTVLRSKKKAWLAAFLTTIIMRGLIIVTNISNAYILYLFSFLFLY